MASSCREPGKCKASTIIKFVSELPKGPSVKVQRLKLIDT